MMLATIPPMPNAEMLAIGMAIEGLQIVRSKTPSRCKQAHDIRRRVFIEEQHVPEEIEMDEDDAHAFHALALLDGTPVGCGRFVRMVTK